SRFTFNAADNDSPLWSPDGTRLVFASNRNGRRALYQKPINAGTNEDLLVGIPMLRSIESWSMDGRLIAFTGDGDRGKTAIGILDVNEHRPTLIQSAFSLRSPSFSPDGRWLAYVSDETGRDEVYVTSFPGQESKWQISVDGGTVPKWRGDGREL